MINDSNTIVRKQMAERLLSCLTMCHNILRSQDGMSPESAFRELNKLLFVKYISEKEGEDWKYSNGEDYIHRIFDKVKLEFKYEHLFDSSDIITARAVSYRDVLGSLSDFRISYANKEIGSAYDSFVHKILRYFSEEPVIPHVVAENIVDFLNIKQGSNVVDPFCGYGALLSEIVSQRPEERNCKTFGYERDMMLAQAAKMNMLMHGDKDARIERTTGYQYSFKSQFDFVVTCIKRRETVWRGIQEAMELLGPEGKAALLIPDDILQKDQYEYERRELLRRHTIRAIVSLPASAIRTQGRQAKWSVLIIQANLPHDINDKTLFAKVENAGVSTLGLPSEKNDFKVIEPIVFQWMKNGAMESGKNVMWVNLLATREWNVEAELLREESRFATQYHLYKLKDLVEIVSIPAAELPRDEYKQVTVRKNQHDVILRDRVLVKDIKDIKRQSIVRAGQMIVSRINAKDGAIGIVPQELDGAIVSDNFIVLNFKSNSVDPYYMLMLLTSERYRKMLKGISRGVTARSYVRNIDFLEMEVPVPDMEKQLELIGDMAGIQQKINNLEKQWEDGIKRFSKELFGQ